MNFYIIYEMPIWSSFLIIVLGCVLFSLVGQYILSPIVKNWWEHKHDNNDLLSFYLSGISMFYSITLGLIAVGTWETFQSTSEIVVKESATLASLYRVCNYLPEPFNQNTTSLLYEYTNHVINVDWPQHAKGQISDSSTRIIDRFQAVLFSFEPKTQKDGILFKEALNVFDKFVEVRRMRIASATSQVPSVLWIVVLLGGFINLFTVWLFMPETKTQGVLFNALFSATVGIMVFSILMLDNPFRGEVSITSEPFQIVLHQLMLKK